MNGSKIQTNLNTRIIAKEAQMHREIIPEIICTKDFYVATTANSWGYYSEAIQSKRLEVLLESSLSRNSFSLGRSLGCSDCMPERSGQDWCRLDMLPSKLISNPTVVRSLRDLDLSKSWQTMSGSFRTIRDMQLRQEIGTRQLNRSKQEVLRFE